jgi:hypothetical protein
MTMPISFSAAILRALVADPDMPDTVGLWLHDEPDPVQRVSLFSIQLAEDFAHSFQSHIDPKDPDAWQQELHNVIIEMASARTLWSHLARKLLRYFSTPAALSFPRNVRQLPCFAPPAERGGPSVN